MTAVKRQADADNDNPQRRLKQETQALVGSEVTRDMDEPKRIPAGVGKNRNSRQPIGDPVTIRQLAFPESVQPPPKSIKRDKPLKDNPRPPTAGRARQV